jgi:hypothetical protein
MCVYVSLWVCVSVREQVCGCLFLREEAVSGVSLSVRRAEVR